MKRKLNKFTWLAVCVALAAVVMQNTLSVSAAEGTGSITVHYHGCTEADVSMNLPGAEFVLYPVGQQQDGIWTLTDDFEGAGISLQGDTASARAEQAGRLYDYAVAQNIPGMSRITDGQGKTTFRNLENGLYLVAQRGALKLADGSMYISSPFLLSVPTEIDGALTNQVVTEPKSGWEGEESPEPVIPPTQPEQPATGDRMPVGAAVLLLLVSGAALSLLAWKNRKKKNAVS